MIIGGVAVIALGVPRLTVDIDATVSGAGLEIDRLAALLGRHGIAARVPNAAAFARQRQVFLGIHKASGTPIDVSIAWLPFEEEALAARQRRDYAGVEIRVPRAEDLLIYKLIANRPQDIEDAEGLLLLYARRVDLRRIRAIVRQFAGVLDDTSRLEVLDRLTRRARLRAERSRRAKPGRGKRKPR